MKGTTRNLLIVGGVTMLLFVTSAVSFVVGAHPPSRFAVLDAITRGGFSRQISGLDYRETMRRTQERTAETLSRLGRTLSVEEQKQMQDTWHDLQVWDNMWFLGIPIMKYPMDLWVMHYIISEVRPDYIVETGTSRGGSALFLAAMLELLELEDSRVITVDIADETAAASEHRLWKKYVEFTQSSSTDRETVESIAERVKGETVIVTLDSNHEAHHVLQELRLYGPMVSPGSYLIVEDTHLDGVPVAPQFGPGPMTALIEYLDTGGAELFEQDLTREAYVVTQNPGGWLRRKSE